MPGDILIALRHQFSHMIEHRIFFAILCSPLRLIHVVFLEDPHQLNVDEIRMGNECTLAVDAGGNRKTW